MWEHLRGGHAIAMNPFVDQPSKLVRQWLLSWSNTLEKSEWRTRARCPRWDAQGGTVCWSVDAVWPEREDPRLHRQLRV